MGEDPSLRYTPRHSVWTLGITGGTILVTLLYVAIITIFLTYMGTFKDDL